MPVSLTVIRLSQRRGSISVLIKVYMTLLRLATHLSVTPRIDLAHTNGIEICSCAGCPDGFYYCTSAQGEGKGKDLLSLHGAFCDRDQDCWGDDGFCEGKSQTGCIAAPTGQYGTMTCLCLF